MANNKKKDRKTTTFGLLLNRTEQMKPEVDRFMYNYMYNYSFMFRFAFKRLLEIERVHWIDEDMKKAVQRLEKEPSARTGYPILVAKDNFR